MLNPNYFGDCELGKIERNLKWLSLAGFRIYIGAAWRVIDYEGFANDYDLFITFGKDWSNGEEDIEKALAKAGLSVKKKEEAELFQLFEIEDKRTFERKQLLWFPTLQGKCWLVENLDFVNIFGLEVNPAITIYPKSNMAIRQLLSKQVKKEIEQELKKIETEKRLLEKKEIELKKKEEEITKKQQELYGELYKKLGKELIKLMKYIKKAEYGIFNVCKYGEVEGILVELREKLKPVAVLWRDGKTYPLKEGHPYYVSHIVFSTRSGKAIGARGYLPHIQTIQKGKLAHLCTGSKEFTISEIEELLTSLSIINTQSIWDVWDRREKWEELEEWIDFEGEGRTEEVESNAGVWEA